VSYVPGHKHDLFFSYARAESAWVGAFRIALGQELLVKLGIQPVFWQDVRNIGFGQDWSDEIHNAVREAAAFLAIWSPAYYQSEWCANEYLAFAPGANLDALKAGSFYRLLKIIKTPHPDRLHDFFFSRLQAIEFFNKANEEYLPGSPEFAFETRRAANAIAELLRTMRNGKQAVYLGSAPIDLREERSQLRTQLVDYGYDVRPEGNLSSAYGDIAEKEIERSVIAIFLVGGIADEFVDQQIQTAKDLRRPTIVWIHPRKSKSATGSQADLISRLRELLEAPAGSQLLSGNSIQDVFRDVVELLAPNRADALASQRRSGHTVYLIHDSTQSREVDRAERVRALIREQQMTVVPETSAAPSLANDEQFMRQSDGVLLVRGEVPGPDRWLGQNLGPVCFAETVYDLKAPLKAKALLLAKPELAAGAPGVDVLRYAEPVTAGVLKPFFDKMLEVSGTHAGD
jgi:hypothetical protein